MGRSATAAAATASKKKAAPKKAAPKKEAVSLKDFADEQVLLFRALADATRLQICMLLRDQDRSVGDLADAVQQGQPATSHHLSILRSCAVIDGERTGKNVIYTLLSEDVRDILKDAQDLNIAPRASRAGQDAAVASARGLASRFKMLGDATRLMICVLLSQEAMNVGEICAALGLGQPAVSHHLALLRNSRVVQAQRDGKNVVYSLAAEDVKKFIDRMTDRIDIEI